MSVEAVNAVMWGLVGVDPSAKLLAMILAEHVHSDGDTAFPSIGKLSLLSGLSARRVQELLRNLETHGWLSRVVASNGGSTNVYKLPLGRLKQVRAGERAKWDAHTGARRRMVDPATHRRVADAQTMRQPAGNGAMQSDRPCDAPRHTLRPAAPEPVLTLSTGFEPERGAPAPAVEMPDASPPIEKENGEPGRPAPAAAPTECDPDCESAQRIRKLAERFAKAKAVLQ